MRVVRLECRVRFLVEGRVRLPLDRRLTFGLRRAKPHHLHSCVGVHAPKDATPGSDSQGESTKVHKHPTPSNTGRLESGQCGSRPSDRGIAYSIAESCKQISENFPSKTVWEIAEGLSRVLHRRLEAADRGSFDPSWPPPEPPFRDTSRFSKQFLHALA
jgi:hypothetical protein